MEPMTTDQALEMLGRQSVAHLGVIDGDEPRVYPMSFVLDDDRVLFRTLSGAKLDAIRANPKVCVEVSSFDEETGSWESVIVSGTARFVESANERQQTISRLFAKYQKVMGSPLSAGSGVLPLGGEAYVIEVPMDEISGMSSHGGFHIRTRPGRL